MNDTTLIELAPTASRPNPLGAARASAGARSSRRAAVRAHCASTRAAPCTNSAVATAPGLPPPSLVKNPAFYAELAYGGSVGAAESYMLGHWTLRRPHRAVAPDAREPRGARLARRRPARVSRRCGCSLIALHRNTRAGSRRNIAAHYDLGNDFFRADARRDDDVLVRALRAAGHDPRRGLARQARPRCAASSISARRTTCSRSAPAGAASPYTRPGATAAASPPPPSRQPVRAREASACGPPGLADRVTVLLEDYRDLRGRYDRLVSIEMIEAIGHRQFGEFFRALRRPARARRPHGAAGHHHRRPSLRTRRATRSTSSSATSFPAACIPSVGALTERDGRRAATCGSCTSRTSGPHYATTLAAWRAQLPREPATQCGRSATRTPSSGMWEFYLCYCEAGFAERALGDVQMLLEVG